MPDGPLQIAIVHQNANTRNILQGAVLQMGHTVCFLGGSGRELIEHACNPRPDLIILQARLPEGSGIDVLAEVCGEEAIPIILLLNRQDEPFVEPADAPPVLAVLPEPIRSTDLIPLIPLVMQQFAQQQKLRKGIAELEKQMNEEG